MGTNNHGYSLECLSMSFYRYPEGGSHTKRKSTQATFDQYCKYAAKPASTLRKNRNN